ncbi:MAG: hypothetical protein SD837_02975 [Candidatus Electrothrix scaldis]|nr:MAG: hypothetical protein SD837_02975 [Candidatus Electrothrix sp. GW3-3]
MIYKQSGLDIYLTEGLLLANEQAISAKNQVRVQNPEHLVIKGDELADFILLDVPAHSD